MIAKVQVADVSAMDVKSWESIREELSHQTELAVQDYQHSLQPPSTVAFTAIINAIEID
jgi:hypothetical protein